MFGMIGYWTFLPKYMESQFQQSASRANIVTGKFQSENNFKVTKHIATTNWKAIIFSQIFRNDKHNNFI